MIIVLKPAISGEEKQKILDKISALGLKTIVSQGVERSIIGVIGEEDVLRVQPFEAYPGVEQVIPILSPYKLVSQEFKKEPSVIVVRGVPIGGKDVAVMAGPCAIENYELLRDIAREIKRCGAQILRGGAFKPRTSPYSFQGLGEEGLKMLQQVGEEFNLVTVTEVMDPRNVGLVCRYADILQIGARNMQNFDLLREVGKAKKPVLLKRGLSATIKEFLMSAEYILSEGNLDVILCERGIRTFETFTRNTLDINAVPAVKQLSHLPIVVDPSHATGKWGLVIPAAKAAVAAGCDGLIIEVHTHPEEATSDGDQTLNIATFERLMREVRPVAAAVGRAM
ncbi:MAG: 3-deoxy-7-phosphoheptulonate synthase [Candidatus Omnitrophica bacterium]|nr:3-deoxy-7-phosphoheptulonate synthase [Candidatus Omnitrophota bacterium]